MAVGTADVPPESLVYGRTVSPGMTLTWSANVTRDADGAAGTVTVDSSGVPTITGGQGTYDIDFEFNGGGVETYNYGHLNDAAIEAAFTLPAQDANGWSIIPEPEAGVGILVYIDPVSGDDTNAALVNSGAGYYLTTNLPGGTWENPSGITAYKTFGAARDTWTANANNNGGYFLVKESTTLTITDADGALRTWKGKSHTYPHVFSTYGASPATNRAVVRVHPDYGPNTAFSVSTDDSYNHFYNLDFHQQYRDPNHVDFVGYGPTEFGLKMVWFYGGFNQPYNIDGLLMENCIFRYCQMAIGENPAGTCRAVIRRNVMWENYSEVQNIDNLFTNNAYMLMEGNLMYHGGWLIARDPVTYPAGNDVGTHDGGNGATTLNDASAPFEASGNGAACRNTTQGIDGYITSLSTTQATATIAPWEPGAGGSMTFNTGDKLTVYGARMRGQAFDQSHSSYQVKMHGTIVRNNVLIDSCGGSIKITANQSFVGDDASGTHSGGTGDTSFNDSGASFPTAGNGMQGWICKRVRSGSPVRYGVIQSNTATTFAAYYTNDSSQEELGEPVDLEATMTFNNGDTVTIEDVSDWTYNAEDVCYYDNYFVGSPTGIFGDSNNESIDWQLRCLDFRIMNNVFTKHGYLSPLHETDGGEAIRIDFMEDAVVANNVITAVTSASVQAEKGIAAVLWNLNTHITRNRVVNTGQASGTNRTSSRGSFIFNDRQYPCGGSGTKIKYNHFQNKATDHRCIGLLNSGVGFDWQGNKYYSLAAAGEWGELDDVAKTITQVVADTGETGYTETAVTYVNEQTFEDYLTDIGEVTTTTRHFADLYLAMIENKTWDTDLEARYICRNWRDGYTEA